ncbi:DUF4955 domain-containing protein [Rubellicoccus peritrichatus]|uniref:DUF4955 domain-containing protein n=1 Tax=Rubellicoccus peritrichatus TaxID=3080537 RepID=A0AAQ3QT79_9BACT|nr:DUF4955 domain-containing protein [Puniceicoccus sp. CR14]WOO43403.1 DUF4955 domain-containing protein [Puniceicoccus sp. CR14]
MTILPHESASIRDFTAKLALVFLLSNTCDAQVRLFNFIPENTTLTPLTANADGTNQESRTISGTTRTTGTGASEALFSGSFASTSQTSNAGDLSTFIADEESYQINTFTRFQNTGLFSIAAWDFDLAPTQAGYSNLKLNLDLALSSRGGDMNFDVYVSYTDNFSGLSYDSTSTSQMGTGQDIKQHVQNTSLYTKIASFSFDADVDGRIQIPSFSLDPIVSRMPAGQMNLRIAITGSGFRRDMTLYRDAEDAGSGGIGSFISGSPVSSRVKIYNLISDYTSTQPASANTAGDNQESRTITGLTRTQGDPLDRAPYQASFSSTSQSSNAGSLSKFSITADTYKIDDFTRFTNTGLFSILAWDFDLSDVRNLYSGIVLNLDLKEEGSFPEDNEYCVYLSYTKEDGSQSYDNLATDSMGTGQQIKARVLQTSMYEEIARLPLPEDTENAFVLNGYNLQQHISQMDLDDSRIRVALVGSGFRRDLTLYRDATDPESSGVGSSITGFENSSQTYSDFLSGLASGEIPKLPDFSYTGLNSQADIPPEITPATHTFYNVTDYGAIANDGLSDRSAIIATVAAAENDGGPAVVFFPPGRFIARDADDVGAPSIRIKKDNIVIKGSGMYSSGTEIVIKSESHNNYVFSFKPDLQDVSFRGARTLTNLPSLPARGMMEVEVDNTSQLNVGDIVRLAAVLPNTFDEFKAYFAPLSDDGSITEYFNFSSGGGFDWRSDFYSNHEITSIDGNTVRFKEPIQAEYEFASETYIGGPRIAQIYEDGDKMMENSGVEDIAFSSTYNNTFSHFFNRAADGYNFLSLSDIRESWVRRVRFDSGSRCLFWESNGKNNLSYDILFEGNSGHYSITVASNSYGVQASYLRENNASHHGFGATSSAFSTVYHRCNQFGGPEGHSGYPQATLYDLNEGDLSLHRIGGAPPHQGKYTTFWNWNQSLFVPTNSGIKDPVTGSNTATTLESRNVDFWPDKIVRPFIIGQHGSSLNVDQPYRDLEVYELSGKKAIEESLFETQLARRLGAVPEWISERSKSFEEVTRYTQVDIASPFNDTSYAAGDTISVTPRFHPKFNLSHLNILELRASRGHHLEFKEETVAASTSKTNNALDWTPDSPGPWRLRLRLTNSLQEEIYSDPIYVYIVPSGGESTLPINSYWHQPRSLEARDIMTLSEDINYTDLDNYHAQVRAIEQAEVQPNLNSSGSGIIDGNINSNATSSLGFENSGATGMVFDLGSSQRIDFVDFYVPSGNANADLFGRLHIQVSDRPDAQYSYTNSDFTWKTVRRFGDARTSGRMRFNGNRQSRAYLPFNTTGRYVRVLVFDFDSRSNGDDLSEITIGSFNAIDPANLSTEATTQSSFSGESSEYFIAQSNGVTLVRDLVPNRDGDRYLTNTATLEFNDKQVLADPLQNWLAQQFSGEYGNPATEPTIWGAFANPDNDSYINLYEYLVSASPTAPTSVVSTLGVESIAPVSFIHDNAIAYTIHVPRNRLGIEYQVQFSNDLTNWIDGPVYKTSFDGLSISRADVGFPTHSVTMTNDYFEINDTYLSQVGLQDAEFIRINVLHEQ